MNVALVTYSLGYGGVSTFVLSLAKQFSANGDTVTILTTESKGIWFDQVDIPNVSCKYVSGLASWLKPSFLYTYKIAAEFEKNHFDLILVNNCRQALAALSLLKEKPFAISVIHNDHSVLCRNACVNEAAIDAVVAVSPAVYKRASGMMKDQHKLFQILNAIEDETEERYRSRSSYKLSDPIQILFVGRIIDQQKGIFLLPEIASLLKEKSVSFQLEVIGEGQDQKELQQRIDAVHLGDSVKLLGYVPHEKVMDKLLQAHVLLVPSYFEGLPLNVLEAMMRGCVPVMSALPQITDICFTDSVEGISCKVGDTAAFADAIERFYLGRADWKQYSTHARNRAETMFSVKRMFKEYLSLAEKSNFAQHKKAFGSVEISWVDLLPLNLLNAYIKAKNNVRRLIKK